MSPAATHAPGPRSVERPADAGSTLVGVLDDPAPARVDRAGLVQPAGMSWLVDWWIGAEDRWHFPAREPSVRQQRVGMGPVVETRLRVPGGDIVHRTFPLPGGGTAIEVHNDTAVGVVLAVAVRLLDLAGRSGRPTTLGVDDDAIAVDGRPVLTLPRPAVESAVGGDDVLDELGSGRGLCGPTHEDAASQAVAVYPLPHRTSLRFALLPVGADRHVLAAEVAAADVAAVVRSWDALVESGGRFVSPDNGVDQRVGAARARLLVEDHGLGRALSRLGPGSGRLLRALACTGADGDTRDGLLALAEALAIGDVDLRHADAGELVEVVVAAGLALAARDDAELADTLLGPLTQLAAMAERGRPDRRPEVLGGLAWSARTAGQPEAASYLWQQQLGALAIAGEEEDAEAGSWEECAGWLDRSGPTGAIGEDELEGAVQLWNAYRSVFLAEDAGGVVLLPGFPVAWRGGGVEVHRAATAWGPISFALRWHGHRPALLWEVHRSDWSGRLRCPALDPDWSSEDRTGEALLAGTSEVLPEPPSAGESFA